MHQPATHIGIITALRREARLLLGSKVELARTVRLDSKLSVYVCGIGQQRAERAASALLEAGCEALVSFGTAGGLQAGLQAGALVIPERVIDEDGRDFSADREWRLRLLEVLENPGLIHSAQVLASVTRPVSSSEDKSALARLSGACAVDMESAAVTRLAQVNKFPSLVVRAVSDDQRQSLPTALMPTLDIYGEPRISVLLKALFAHPGILRHLPGLARGIGAAERTLADVVSRAGLRFSA